MAFIGLINSEYITCSFGDRNSIGLERVMEFLLYLIILRKGENDECS